MSEEERDGLEYLTQKLGIVIGIPIFKPISLIVGATIAIYDTAKAKSNIYLHKGEIYL